MSLAVLARKTKTLQRGRSDKRGLILNMTGRGGGIGLTGLSYKYRGNSSLEVGGKCRQGGAQGCCVGGGKQCSKEGRNACGLCYYDGLSQPAPQMCYGNYINRRSQAAHRPGGMTCCTNEKKMKNKIIWKQHPDIAASDITEHRKQATLRCAKSMVVRTEKRIGNTLLHCKITAKMPESCAKKCINSLAVPLKGRLAYTRINNNDCVITKQVEVNNSASDYTDTAKQRAFLCKCADPNKDNKACGIYDYCYPKPTTTGNNCNLSASDKKRLACYRSGEKCLNN